MKKTELTDAFIRSLKVEARAVIPDTKETGLALHIQPTGAKSFAFRIRGNGGKIQRVKIGNYPDLKLAAARLKAAELRSRAKNGEDITAAAKKIADAAASILEVGIPTLGAVLHEYENEMSSKRKIWRRTKNGNSSEAERRIRAVFKGHLPSRVTDMTLINIAKEMSSYKPKSGKAKANGQVSRARSYLMPVLDWCAHRNRFNKIGLGRPIKLDVVDLRQTVDPAADDYDIKGVRDRALDHLELGRILPLLVWPAPERLKMKLVPEVDLRPIALRFLFFTCARLDELVVMKWGDFRENSRLWHKPYVKTVSGPPRQQSLHLSDAAVDLLKSLPNFQTRGSSELVFPNQAGNGLGNWGRITKAVQRESETSDWHRHDLRRTGSTIMKLLGVAPRIIDEILAHNAPNEDEGTSRALENYFSSGHLLEHVENPQKAGLDKLAEALAFVEGKSSKQNSKPK